MSVTLIGCAAEPPRLALPPIDLSSLKIPEIRPGVVAALKAEVEPPAPPVTRAGAASYIDALRGDIEAKRGAGWELVETVNQCRAPIRKAKDAARLASR